MEVIKKYVVYELNKVMGSKKHLALEEVSFRGFKLNWFDTEEEAIQALVEEGRSYVDFVILREIKIRQS